MQRDKFATNFSVETHISKTASGHMGFMAGICGISPPPSLRRPSLTFKKGHAALGKCCRRNSVHGGSSGLWPPLETIPKGLSKQEAV